MVSPGCRSGVDAEAELSSLGNPVDHLKSLANKKKLEPRGEPSLQNILEMARSGLSCVASLA